MKTYLKTLYVSIIFCIFTAYAFQSYSGTVSGGGGSEVEANFIEAAHTLISAFKDHSEVDFKTIGEAFSSLKDIEVVDVLRDSKGSPIPNANLHYAWVEDGILKLRGDWWASQFEKNKDVRVAVAHELFRVAFWYSAGDKKFNDDKYQITIGKMRLAGQNLAEILLPNICQPASYRTLDTHVFSDITRDQDGGRYDACPAVSAGKIVLKVPSGRVQVKHLILVLQNEKTITLDDLIAYGEPNAKRYKDGFINSGEAVELFFNSRENVKAYSLFLESFARGSSVEVTLSPTGLKSRLIKLLEKHDTVLADVIETDDLPIMDSFAKHLDRVHKMDRVGSFVKYAAYLDELERVIDEYSNIVNDLKYSKTTAAANKARADEAKKRNDTEADTETEAHKRYNECVSKIPPMPEYSTFGLEMGIHQIFTDFIYVTMADAKGCGVRSRNPEFYDQGRKLKNIKTALVHRGSMVEILSMQPRVFGKMELDIYTEKEYLKTKVLHHEDSSRPKEEAKIDCEGYVLADDLKKSAYEKVKRLYDSQKNTCFYNSGLRFYSSTPAKKARADEAKKQNNTAPPYTPNPGYVPTAPADSRDDIACSMANNSESHCRSLSFCQWIWRPGSCLGRRAQDDIPCSMNNNSQRTCNKLSICLWVDGQGSCVGRRR